MDEHDSSTPNKDCWHSTYGFFASNTTPGPFPDFWVGPGDKANHQHSTHQLCVCGSEEVKRQKPKVHVGGGQVTKIF